MSESSVMMVSPVEPDFSSMSVLLIDDQDYVRVITAQLLRRLGVSTIHEAANGQAAVERLESIEPDVILCDIRMQPVDGWEFLHHLRSGKAGRRPDIPLIFLTSVSDRATNEAAANGAIDGYLMKPVSAQDLKTALQRAVHSPTS